MQIADIFFKTKAVFRYTTDKSRYGEREKWITPQLELGFKIEIIGDCEDFALACRFECRKHGIESRLVLCFTETKEMHCVLESDGMILDNRMKTVMSIDDLPYRWLAMSGYEKGDKWTMIVLE